MVAAQVDTRPSLYGQSEYGPTVPILKGPARLWQYFVSPRAQYTVLLYNDGSYTEKMNPTVEDQLHPDLHTLIPGGSDFRAVPGSFEYEALVDNGFGFRDNGAGGGVEATRVGA